MANQQFRSAFTQPATGNQEDAWKRTHAKSGTASGITQGRGIDTDKVDNLTGQIGEIGAGAADRDYSIGSASGKIDMGEKFDASNVGAENREVTRSAMLQTQQMAKGVDQYSQQANASALRTQGALQGASMQEARQRMVQMGMSSSQITSQMAMMQRDNESQMADMLVGITSASQERQREAVGMLAQMSLSARELDQRDAQMELNDKWERTKHELAERGQNIEAEISERKLQLEADGLSLEAIGRQLEAEFGKSSDARGWEQIAIDEDRLELEKIKEERANTNDEKNRELMDAQIKRLEEEMKMLEEQVKMEKTRQKIDGIESFNKMLGSGVIDLTTTAGVEQAKLLYGEMLGISDPEELNKMWDSMDFTTLKKAQFEGRADSSRERAATTLLTGDNKYSDYVDKDGKFSLFDEDGRIINKEAERDILTDIYNRMGGTITDKDGNTFDSEAEFIEAFTTNPQDFDHLQTMVDSQYGSLLKDEDTREYEATMGKIDMWESSNEITSDDADALREFAKHTRTLGITGGLIPELDEDGELIIKDSSGRVLYPQKEEDDEISINDGEIMIGDKPTAFDPLKTTHWDALNETLYDDEGKISDSNWDMYSKVIAESLNNNNMQDGFFDALIESGELTPARQEVLLNQMEEVPRTETGGSPRDKINAMNNDLEPHRGKWINYNGYLVKVSQDKDSIQVGSNRYEQGYTLRYAHHQ